MARAIGTAILRTPGESARVHARPVVERIIGGLGEWRPLLDAALRKPEGSP
jgi:hypothetical protein